MSGISDRFWSASLEEIKRGYVFDGTTEEFICLACGRRYEKGVIYPDGEVLLEAERSVRRHIIREHLSIFHHLVQLNRKYTGLTDLQRSLLQYFYEGFTDREIAEKLEIGSTSTVRNHRFALREKEKQAKVYLAIMELLGDQKERTKSAAVIPAVKAGNANSPAEEREKMLKGYFKEGLDGPLSEFPAKEKRKIAVLEEIIQRFDPERTYTEKEVNEILKEIYHDHVWIRRHLIEYGLMERVVDGSAYWVKREELKKMNRAELKQQYKETKQPMGVLQITNTVNGKIFIVGGPYMQGLIGRHRFQLKMNGHPNKELQQDWNRYGEENFAFEIVEVLEQSDDPTHDNMADLKTLEEIWLEKLQPFGDQGYNRR